MSVFKLTGFECGGIVMELFGRPVTDFWSAEFWSGGTGKNGPADQNYR